MSIIIHGSHYIVSCRYNSGGHHRVDNKNVKRRDIKSNISNQCLAEAIRTGSVISTGFIPFFWPDPLDPCKSRAFLPFFRSIWAISHKSKAFLPLSPLIRQPAPKPICHPADCRVRQVRFLLLCVRCYQLRTEYGQPYG